MSEFRETIPDDERDVPLDDEVELELPPPTLDERESIEEEPEDEERESAIEAGEVDPGD
ncbi:hypothetical protein [Microbacterium invictum]|uniref:Uncharacterized protein n=1 Tax=Microbacterium invictum TaxID=515415 RepID=A0AA40VMC7_9MICO|nr:MULTISPECIES: hypothetical protein [Microbacterium]MBB4139549.1 hypothetical protein [Microbacterium invictum]